MKKVVEAIFCDVEANENGQLVEARHTLTLTVGENNGNTSVELDLSEYNHTVFWEAMRRWFDIGREPAASNPVLATDTQAKRDRKAKEPGKSSRRSPSAAAIRNRRMREFANANGIEYNTYKDGSYSYPKALRDLFAKWEAENPA